MGKFVMRAIACVGLAAVAIPISRYSAQVTFAFNLLALAGCLYLWEQSAERGK
jgi:non-ribosomal peptide synthetase component F